MHKTWKALRAPASVGSAALSLALLNCAGDEGVERRESLASTGAALSSSCDPSSEQCCPADFEENVLSDESNSFASSEPNLCVRALGGSDQVMVGPGAYVLGGSGDDNINAWGGGTVFPGPGVDTVSVSSAGTVVIHDASEAAAGETLYGGGDGTLITPVPLEQLHSQGVTVSGFTDVIVLGPPGDPSGATSGPLKIKGRLRDASGNPIVGARIDLKGAERAVRFSDFSGAFVFHVNPGSYSLIGAAGCLVTPVAVKLDNLSGDVTQDFVATRPGCVTATASDVIATGAVLTLTEGQESLGRTFVRVEQRSSAADAMARLQQIVQEQPAASRSLTIAGHPAIERETIIPAVKILIPNAAQTRNNLALTTAIAVGSTVVRFESRMPEDAPAAAVERFFSAGRNFDGENVGDLHGSVPPVQGMTQNAPAAPPELPVNVAPGTADEVMGELAVAASDSANAFVVAAMNQPFFSLDAGRTLQRSTWNTVVPPGAASFDVAGDPSAAVGAPDANGKQTLYATYLATVIKGKPPGIPPTIAISLFQSNDNGQTFNPAPTPFPLNCAVAANNCVIPDQVQLAADRRNRAVAAGGQTFDQLYMAWRHFGTAGSRIVFSTALACSADGGSTWKFDYTSLTSTGADRPRIRVAPDGSLLVAYGVSAPTSSKYRLMVQKFSSCAAGLQPASSPFPVTVANPKEPAEMAGMPRQPAANYSIAGSAADTSGKALFVAYTDESSQGNDDVHVAQSSDGGATWPKNTVMNTRSSGHRYFPSICATETTAFVSWYDRRAGAAAGASPDLTAYFRSSLLDNGATAGKEFNVTGDGFEDPQCLTGFPEKRGSTTSAAELLCTNLPNVLLGTGQCRKSSCSDGSCSLNACDYRASIPSTCATGETCSVPAGAVSAGWPKYGDYNGSDCAQGRVFMAWAAGRPPSSGCDLDGQSCSVDSQCCSGNCVGNTCAPTAAACTANAGACTNDEDCCSENCQGGQCFPRIGIYSTSTSCATDNPADPSCPRELKMSLRASIDQLGGPRICGSGSGFSPNGKVGITYFDVPGGSPPEKFIIGTANASGALNFHDFSQQSNGKGWCTQDDLAKDVSIEISDEVSGETLTQTSLPTCLWCLNSVCPTNVNGGCN